MDDIQQPIAKELNRLRDQLAGQPFLRSTTDGIEERYHVLSEVEVSGVHYAVMHKHEEHPDDAYLFRINENSAEEIDDEMEWEQIAEAVDEWLYFQDQ